MCQQSLLSGLVVDQDDLHSDVLQAEAMTVPAVLLLESGRPRHVCRRAIALP